MERQPKLNCLDVILEIAYGGKIVFPPKNTVPTMIFGGSNIAVLGCFLCKSCISVIHDIINAALYQNILKAILIISVEILEHPHDLIFQQVKDTKHTAKSTKT